MTKRIALLTPTLNDHDAISQDAFGMARALRGVGHEVAFFTGNALIEEPESEPCDQLAGYIRSESDVLIYHFGTGWSQGLELLRSVRCRRVIKYHNVTPARFFEGINDGYHALCEAGRRQLVDLARADCDLLLSASRFNMEDLLRAGSDPERTRVMPPFHQVDRLQEAADDPQTIRLLDGDRAKFLMVGRIAPNKGHARLLECFATYRLNYEGAADLYIVGQRDERLGVYNRLLDRYTSSYSLAPHVHFLGDVSDAALGTLYREADLFWITSEHEGFCVPLVEAMSMGLPILAYGSSAIPETVGPAGLVWRESDPRVLAAAANYLLTHEKTRAALAERGHERYERCFSNQKIEEIFLDAIGPLL